VSLLPGGFFAVLLPDPTLPLTLPHPTCTPCYPSLHPPDDSAQSLTHSLFSLSATRLLSLPFLPILHSFIIHFPPPLSLHPTTLLATSRLAVFTLLQSTLSSFQRPSHHSFCRPATLLLALFHHAPLRKIKPSSAFLTATTLLSIQASTFTLRISLKVDPLLPASNLFTTIDAPWSTTGTLVAQFNLHNFKSSAPYLSTLSTGAYPSFYWQYCQALLGNSFFYVTTVTKNQ